MTAAAHNRSPHASDPALATRELIVEARLVIRDFRDDRPSSEDVQKYLDIFVECETGESDWWLTDAAVTRLEITEPARPL